MLAKIKETFDSWCNLIICSAIGLCFLVWLPINIAYSWSLSLGGNFTYADQLGKAISSFDSGNSSAAETLMQKATDEAEHYPFAIGPDAGNDLAKRAEKLGDKALKDKSSYARAAFLFGHAQDIRSHFSDRTTPWLIEKYLWFFYDFKKVTIKTRINSARAFNLERRCDKSEPILLKLSSELLNYDSRSLISKIFDRVPKKGSKHLSRRKLQYLVLTQTELVDVLLQKGLENLVDQQSQKVLELCSDKRVSPATIKDCAKRLGEMGRKTDALKVYEELHKKHFDEEDDD